MEINHFNKIKKLCSFDGGSSFYEFTAILNKDDFKTLDHPLMKKDCKQECIIKQWMIDNENQLEDCIKEMYSYVKYFKCRIYFYTNRRSKKKLLLNIRNKVNKCLDLAILSPNVFTNINNDSLVEMLEDSQISCNSIDREKKYLVFKTTGVNPFSVMKIENMCGDDHIITLKGINGYNIVANKNFNPNDKGFRVIEIKENVKLKQNPRIIIAK